MTPWKLPLVVAGISIPIIVGFYFGGGGAGLAVGAFVVLVILLVAIRARPMGPIGAAPAGGRDRHVLIVATDAVEAPADIARIATAAGLGGSDGEVKTLVLVPARIGFLDRWASDIEPARHRAQQHLVITVAALAKAGIAAEARVGDEDVVQAVEDQLQSFPATEVVLVSGEEDDAEEAASELRSRLRAAFHQVRLGGNGEREPAR